jgi:hypothetical protein
VEKDWYRSYITCRCVHLCTAHYAFHFEFQLQKIKERKKEYANIE